MRRSNHGGTTSVTRASIVNKRDHLCQQTAGRARARVLRGSSTMLFDAPSMFRVNRRHPARSSERIPTRYESVFDDESSRRMRRSGETRSDRPPTAITGGCGRAGRSACRNGCSSARSSDSRYSLIRGTHPGRTGKKT